MTNNPYILENILQAAQELMNVIKSKSKIDFSPEVLEDVAKLRQNLQTIVDNNNTFNKIFDVDVEKLKKEVLNSEKTGVREKRLLKKGIALEQQANDFKAELEKARLAQTAFAEESEKREKQIVPGKAKKPRRKDWRRLFKSIGMDRR